MTTESRIILWWGFGSWIIMFAAVLYWAPVSPESEPKVPSCLNGYGRNAYKSGDEQRSSSVLPSAPSSVEIPARVIDPEKTLIQAEEAEHNEYHRLRAAFEYRRIEPNWWQAYVAIGAVAVAIIQAIFFLIQLKKMDDSLVQGQLASRNSLRAYVQIVPHSMLGMIEEGVSPWTSGVLKTFLRVENFGSTPAIGMTLQCGYFIAPNLPLGESFKLPTAGDVNIARLDVFPNSSVPDERKLKILVTKNWAPFFTDREFEAVLAGTHTLYIFGRGAYRDMFGDEPHILEFCYALQHVDGIGKRLVSLNSVEFPVVGSIADVGNRIG